MDPLGLDDPSQLGIAWTVAPISNGIEVGSQGPYDLQLLARWNTTDALARITTVTNANVAEGNNYAARLYEAWLSGEGSFTPSKQDEIQVQKDSYKWVKSEIEWDMYWEQDVNAPECPAIVNGNLTSDRFEGDFMDELFTSNQNINLFHAFGNVGFKIDYTATRTAERGYWDCECDYLIEYTLQFRDTFAFATKGGVRNSNPYYSAAYWLEKNGHATKFDHSITVNGSFTYTSE